MLIDNPYKVAATVFFLLLFSLQSLPALSGDKKSSDYKLIWQEEFNYSGKPRPADWPFDIGGHGWGNQEKQYYTNRLGNARIRSGKLEIIARKEDYKNRSYTSARLVTRGKRSWEQVRIEIRAQIPSVRGVLPAIWMLPAGWTFANDSIPLYGEIDIAEHAGYMKDTMHAAIHVWPLQADKRQSETGSVHLNDIGKAFHNYVLDWTKNSIIISVDNEVIVKKQLHPNSVFHRPYYLLLNIAVGGTWAGRKGIDATAFPVKMQIDYIRVYQKY